MIHFLHIPKTGGTTLRAHLDNEHALSHHAVKSIAEIPPSDLDTSICSGHYHFLGPEHRYITILRHPIKRVTSLYHFIMRSPRHYLYNEIKHLTLEKFCKEKYYETRDWQTRIISGTVERDLDLAKHNIEQFFLEAGTTCEFTSSMERLKKLLKWHDVPSYRLNATKYPEPTTAERRAIARNNHKDMKLFEWVKERNK